MLQGVPKGGEINQSHSFSSQKQIGFWLRKINDWQMISPIKDLGAVKI